MSTYISQISYTPVSNIIDGAILDGKLVKSGAYDSYNDTFKMVDKRGFVPDRTDTLINVSLYNDIVIIDGVHCKILGMLTKSKELWEKDLNKAKVTGECQ